MTLSATYINWLEKVEHIDARSWTIWCMVRSTYTTDTVIYSTCRQVSRRRRRRRRGQFLADRVLSVTMTGGTRPIYGQPSRNILAFLAHAMTKRKGPSLNRTTTLSVSNGPPLSTYSHWRECLNTIEHAVFSCSGYLNISSFSIRTW